MAEIIESLRQDHRAIEKMLLVLEHELGIFSRGERPDYEVIQTAIDYFRNYPDSCHHPKEDVVFDALKGRDPATAVRVGDLPAEHRDCADRLDRAARAVESVLADGEILRQTVDDLVRDFIEHERRHMAMEERVFFPAALAVLREEDWTRVTATITAGKAAPSSRLLEARFDEVRQRIVRLEEEAEAERG